MVTGASGAGKTAAVERLEARGHPHVSCHYFDSIGIPSVAVMRRDFGGPERWQAWATRLWIERLSGNAEEGVVSVLDSQTRPSFVLEALAESPVAAPATRIVLLDCSAAVRRHRLLERGHPELASDRMESWAAYLRAEADDLGLRVVDTSDLSIDAVADVLEAEVEAMRAEG